MVKTTTRQRVLQAALACVAEEGVDAVTIEQIRQRSGVSVGSIYHHFGGRLAILAALYVEGVSDHSRRATAALEDTSSLEEGLEALIGTYLNWVGEHPQWGKFLLSARPLVEQEAAAGLRESNRASFGVLRRWLERWPETRALARQPVFALAQIYGPAEYLARLWLDGVLPGEPGDHVRKLARAATAAITASTD